MIITLDKAKIFWYDKEKSGRRFENLRFSKKKKDMNKPDFTKYFYYVGNYCEKQ